MSSNKNYSDLKYTSLSALLSGDSYEGLIRLALITGPGVEQTLTSVASSSGIKSPVDESLSLESPSVKQYAAFDVVGESSTAVESISSTSLQTSLLLTYQGGNKLQFVGDERNVRVYYYESSGINVVSNSSGFIEVSKLAMDGNKITIPGAKDKDCAVFAAYNSDTPNNVHYFIAKANTSYTVANGEVTLPSTGGSGFDFLGIPKVASINANCYVFDDTEGKWKYKTLGDYIGTDSDKSLDTIFSNISGFSPLYVPETNETLADATTPSNLFDENHPYNYYTLPKLRNINITISPSSIQS